jgi:hypothetical protein
MRVQLSDPSAPLAAQVSTKLEMLQRDSLMSPAVPRRFIGR